LFYCICFQINAALVINVFQKSLRNQINPKLWYGGVLSETLQARNCLNAKY